MRVLHQLVLALTQSQYFNTIPQTPNESLETPNPAVVLWHGLGDQYDSDGLAATADLLRRKIPNVFVHSVYLDEDPSRDRRASMVGDANRQVELVCEQLTEIPELSHGFHALGFSQGGLFLRALVERCPNITITTLMTFGSPHMGVSDLPLCDDESDWSCHRRNLLLKSQVWRDSVQKSLVPAQYFRDMDHYDQYLEHSNFLADINNERSNDLNSLQKSRFENLHNLVLVQFARDRTLVPKESAYFQYHVSQTGPLVPFDQTDFYMQNWLGLKTLNDAGKVHFHSIDSEHMVIPDEVLEHLVDTYLGVVGARV